MLKVYLTFLFVSWIRANHQHPLSRTPQSDFVHGQQRLLLSSISAQVHTLRISGAAETAVTHETKDNRRISMSLSSESSFLPSKASGESLYNSISNKKYKKVNQSLQNSSRQSKSDQRQHYYSSFLDHVIHKRQSGLITEECGPLTPLRCSGVTKRKCTHICINGQRNRLVCRVRRHDRWQCAIYSRRRSAR